MAKNTIADLDTTPSNNTDFLGQPSSGSAGANTIDSIFQKLAGLLARAYVDWGGGGTVGGTANAITLISASTYQTLEDGMQVAFKATADNTGATTLNLDSIGAKAIRLKGDTALSGGEIIEDGRYLLVYDEAYNSAAGAWVLLNPEPPEVVIPDAGGWTQIGGTTSWTSGATLDLTSIPTTYQRLVLRINGASHNSGSNQNLTIALSDDNGSSWGSAHTVAVAIGSSALANAMIEIDAAGVAGISKASKMIGNQGGAGDFFDTKTAVIDALRLAWSGGAADAGSVTLWGVK